MDPLYIFSHNFLKSDWKEIVTEQILLLHQSGAYAAASEIWYCGYGETQEVIEFIDLIKREDPLLKIRIVIHNDNDNEKPTLVLLQDVMRTRPHGYVMYYHTKGVTSSIRESHLKDNIKSWRKIMQYYVIEEWAASLQHLAEFDAVGCFYDTYTSPYFTLDYFSGNFWIANTTHINNLPPMIERSNWMGCETFVTSIKGNYKSLHIQAPGIPLYEQYFDESSYRRLV